MKVTSEHAHLTVERRFTITEDHPVVAMAYTTTGRKTRIERGTVNYTFSPETGRWIVRNEYKVNLAGTVLLKNGGDSKNEHSRCPVAKYSNQPKPHLVLAEGWEWLQTIIDLLRPNGDLSMTIPLNHEVKA